MIQNPILRGFCPDPSIIRVGMDYYIATSTFEWWPGVKLFHSTDLEHWEQITSPLQRKSQLDMIGNPTSGGVWAPCLSYDGTYFYLVYTDVKTKKGRFYNTHNYLIYTDDIYGEWSDPIYLNSVGFDPSLFHDTDGKKYLINMINGFKGILVQEIDPKTWKLIGERKLVYQGSSIGTTEGPHIYHIGDWYYLITAEGGTGYSHCVTLARAKSVFGPFETAPENPILTADTEDMTALQKCGHADLVDTPYGEWYLVHLCSRPLQGQQWCTLGRETAIQKMEWTRDGWLKLAQGGRFAAMQTPRPVGGVKFAVEHSADFHISFSAESEKLPVQFSSPRDSYQSFCDWKSRPGYLRMKGQESMNSLHHVSLLAIRQQEFHIRAQVRMEYEPHYEEQLAGVTYMYDAMNFYILGKSVNEKGIPVLVLLKSDTGVIVDEITPILLEEKIPIELCIETTEDGIGVLFFYRQGQQEWIQIGDCYTTQILTDEHCRGFTGAHVGMYVHDMMGFGLCADFAEFQIQTVMK